MKRIFTGAVTAGLLMTRMALLGVATLLQLTIGGADIRPPSEKT